MMLRLTPRSSLLPYTTLFRSKGSPVGIRLRAWNIPTAVKSSTKRKRSRAQPFHLGDFFLVEGGVSADIRSEEHTSELQSRGHLVCRLLLEKKKHMSMSQGDHN